MEGPDESSDWVSERPCRVLRSVDLLFLFSPFFFPSTLPWSIPRLYIRRYCIPNVNWWCTQGGKKRKKKKKTSGRWLVFLLPFSVCPAQSVSWAFFTLQGCVCVNPIGEASDVYSLSRSHQDQGQKEMRADCLSVHGQTPEFVCASKHIKRDGK